MDEQWRPIRETKNFYEISNMGRVRRAKAEQGTWSSRLLHVTDGKVNLSFEGHRLNRSVRQLLAKTWPELFSYGFAAKRSVPDRRGGEGGGSGTPPATSEAYFEHVRASLGPDATQQEVEQAIFADVQRRITAAFADLPDAPNLVARPALKGMYLYLNDDSLKQVGEKVLAEATPARGTIYDGN